MAATLHYVYVECDLHAVHGRMRRPLAHAATRPLTAAVPSTTLKINRTGLHLALGGRRFENCYDHFPAL